MRNFLFCFASAFMALGIISTSWANADSSKDDLSISSMLENESSIDDLLVAHLGVDLYESHVVKLTRQGRRYILVADNHDKQFRDLFVHLADEADARMRDFALFFDPFAGPQMSEAFWLHLCMYIQSTHGKVFAIEDQKLFDMVIYITKIYYLHTLVGLDSSWPTVFLKDHKQRFCDEIRNRPEIRECLDRLKKDEWMLAPLIASLEGIVAQNENSNEEPEVSLLGYSNSDWALLYHKMKLSLAQSVRLSEHQRVLLQSTTKHPDNKKAFWDFINAINPTVRSRVALAHIAERIESWPKHTEIVMFVEAEHLAEYVEGLQTTK
ncbi:MAG: hypothetical protein Q8K75_06045 [Chlamydiales bacterium]|nr:hypothetical protein [Chlamydiales bacterium]